MSEKQVSRDIPIGTFIRFWLVMVGFLGTLLVIYFMRNALVLIGIAAFLAIALNPPVAAIAGRLPGKSRIGATALAYIMVVATLLLFCLTVIPTVIDQMAHFAQTLPSIINDISSQTHWINDLVTRYKLEDQYGQVIENIQSQASSYATNAGGSFVTGVGSILNALVTTIIVLVLSFLMLVEGPTWKNRALSLYSDETKRKHHQKLLQKMYRVVTGFVNGQVIISLIASTCSLVTVVILSALFNLQPNLAIPIAVIVFVSGLVPMFGATIGAIIAGLLIGINDVGAAMVFLIYFIIYQQVENNFVSPLVQSRAVEVSALTVLVALTIGLSLFGILGGLVAIPIAGCLRVIILDYIDTRTKQQKNT